MMWHQPVTLAALRMAFREKFGQGHDADIIKIQDPVSRIMYELEDMSDVGPHCLIAMAPTSQDNVSVSAKLDWIRQELQEQGRQRRQQQQQPGGGKANHTVLQQQQEQVEHLRRDLGVLRQVAKEFQQETNALLQELKLKQQEQQQKNSRRYLDETKLRAESVANAITGRLQDLQDTIDQLKLDVTQRRCRPSTAQLEHCTTEVNALEGQIDRLAQLVRTAKPKWKLTWEQELQQVVTEQQFLKDQEGLLLDLRDDHADLVHVLQQLFKISEIQARGNKKVVPLFRGGGGEEGMSSVLKQVSTIDVDHQKRVKALQQAEKMRARELANRIDDFEKELSTFVEAKKLKRTGGADHVDRQRQKKDQQILRDLYQSKTHNNNNNNNNNE
ncbi:actin interacting protein 3-domain-containing protein [Fennellomyces sp. T-0311]|nr:actin interacting protein 3-domain-containing protein [Fennellomyces sp. T-0311]